MVRLRSCGDTFHSGRARPSSALGQAQAARHQTTSMITMIAPNCSSTLSRISFCDVLGLPPRSMLNNPMSSTAATARTAARTSVFEPDMNGCDHLVSLPQQPLEIVELFLWTGRVAKLAAQLLEDPASPLDGGFVRRGNAHAPVREFPAPRRAPERIVVARIVLGAPLGVAGAVRVTLAVLPIVLPHHLLHLLH